MSPALPVISGREAIAILRRIGYEVVRQKGSHVRLRHPDSGRRKPVTVPLHAELKRGVLRAIPRDADIGPPDIAELR